MANHPSWHEQQGPYPPSGSSLPRHHSNHNMNSYPPHPQQAQQQQSHQGAPLPYPPQHQGNVYSPAGHPSGRQSWGTNSSPGGYNGPSPASRSSGPYPGGYESNSPLNAGGSGPMRQSQMAPYGHAPPYQSHLHAPDQQQHMIASGRPNEYPGNSNSNPGSGYPSHQHPPVASHQGSWPSAQLPSVLQQHSANDAHSSMTRPPHLSDSGVNRTPSFRVEEDFEEEDDFDGKGKGRGADVGQASNKGTSDFVKKLFSMLDDKAYESVVSWSPSGESFIVRDMNGFTKHVLPRNFRHSNFASFVRQLNKYDFHKVKNPEDGSGNVGEHIWEFQHPEFVRGREDLLENVKRKTPAKKKGPNKGGLALEGEREDSPALLATADSVDRPAESYNELKAHVIHLTNVQEQMQNHINGLTKQYQGVIGEMLTFQRTMAQQDQLMQNLIQYLMNLEQDRNVEAGSSSSSASMLGGSAPPNEHSFMPSEGSSKLIGAYNNVAQASFAQMSEMTRRAGDAGDKMAAGRPSTNSSMSEATTNPGASHQTSGTSFSSAVPLSPKSAASPMDRNSSRASDAKESGNLINENFLTNSRAEASVSSKSSLGDAINDKSFQTNSTLGTTNPLGITVPKLEADTRNAATDSSVPLNPSANGQDKGSVTPSEKGLGSSRLSARRPTVIPGWTVPPRVLLVDDDEVCRRLSSKFLQVFGCSIDYAVDGMSAVNKMNLEKYDLVLMDIIMPNLDGVSATSLIRQFDPETPIISMTSNSGPSELINYMRSGMNDILPKPFTRDGLLNMLEKHLIHLKSVQKTEPVPKNAGLDNIVEGGLQQIFGVSGDAPSAGGQVDGDASEGGDGTLNPLAGMGFTDEEYIAMLQNLISAGSNSDQDSFPSLTQSGEGDDPTTPTGPHHTHHLSSVNGGGQGQKRAAPSEDSQPRQHQHQQPTAPSASNAGLGVDLAHEAKRGRFTEIS